MKRFVREKLTYANVMASIAVFLTLGGATALAAGQLGKNSVGSKQLKKDAVTSAKIKNGAVTGAKIKPGSITGSNIDLASLGTVPSATKANSAGHATSADSATKADSAGHATSAAGPTTLASGQTEVGAFYIVANGGSSGGFIGTQISFPFPLPSVPQAHYLKWEAPTTPECPGSYQDPRAAPGHLCLYETMNFHTSGGPFFDSSFLELPSEGEGVTRYGAGIAVATPASTENSNLGGMWAVTAP